MTNYRINKVAVLGSGIMGSRIACHFANAGIKVLLLDIVPKELNDKEKAKKLTLDDPAVRNRIVNNSLQAALRSKPSPVFSADVVQRISVGNFEDDMKDIADCDWVIEAVVENLKIKSSVYEQVEKFRKPGTLITSNTSGIPIHLLTKGRSDDFKKHFCGTHFFNPPRYLRLLEIIPTKDTYPEIIDFLMHSGDLYLGKTTVLCKDTPAFIANRIGVFSMMDIFHLLQEMDLNIDEIDTLTGTLIGHPKSATFRTADVVGIDTLVKVANGLQQQLPPLGGDRGGFEVPDFIQRMVKENKLGEKTGAGFYKKEKNEKGSQILTLDLKSWEYKPKSKPDFPSLTAIKPVEDLHERLKMLAGAKDKAGEFFRTFHHHLFAYVSNCIPEISDELYQIDDAMKAGFGWQMGPFEIWDLLGVEKQTQQMKEVPPASGEGPGEGPAAWVNEMLSKDKKHFYKTENGRRLFYDQKTLSYKPVPGTEAFIILKNFSENIVWKNSACQLYDIGDGIVCLAWQTKMNTIGSEVIEGVTRSIDLAEKEFAGLVIGNDGISFSAGANVGLIFMLAVEQEWDELQMAIKSFQNTSMRIRYSTIPVVAAPHGMTLGGGCEFCLHADQVQASAETYAGLVETGLGIIPAGGGSKEFALRASGEYREGEIALNILQKRFLTIATAKVSTSAEEAFDLGILRKGKDTFSMNPNRVIADAKRKAMDMATAGYVAPQIKKDVKVLGREALGAFLTGINGMWRGHYISDHDVKVAQKLAYVMCGGDLSQPTEVSEQYLLDLEREAFISLCGERKTLERIQGLLKTGKVIRN